MIDHRPLLDCWFAAESRDRWFQSTPAFDGMLKLTFEPMLEDPDSVVPWHDTVMGRLASIILFDQVSRNIYRGTAKAFAFDKRAMAVARRALDAGDDQGLAEQQKIFLYMPFEHSEDLADQRRSVALFNALEDQRYLPYAVAHLEIIERFGRFPHRNAALGRTSSAAEQDYLTNEMPVFGKSA